MWDVFISHAWEDKETIARPLANALTQAGVSVWYDEFTLTLGDGLRRSIDLGLSESRYGIVILSPYFFSKNWTQRELDGLVAKEVSTGKTILPVWHNVTHKDIEKFSLTLSDRLGVSTSDGLEKVIREILRVVRPENSKQLPTYSVKKVSHPKPATPRSTSIKANPLDLQSYEKFVNFAYLEVDLDTKQDAIQWVENHTNMLSTHSLDEFKKLLTYAYLELDFDTKRDAAQWAENHLDMFSTQSLEEFRTLVTYAYLELDIDTKQNAAQWVEDHLEVFSVHSLDKFKELVTYAYLKLDIDTKQNAAQWALKKLGYSGL